MSSRVTSYFRARISGIRGTISFSMKSAVVSAIMRCSSERSSTVKTSSGARSSMRKLPPRAATTGVLVSVVMLGFSVTVKTKSGATYDDLVKVPDTFVAEIVEGDLFASPRPRGRHTLAASVLAGELRSALPPRPRSRAGWVVDRRGTGASPRRRRPRSRPCRMAPGADARISPGRGRGRARARLVVRGACRRARRRSIGGASCRCTRARAWVTSG